MSDTTEINAQSRVDVGKGASRRLRRTGLVPGIVYGAHRDPQMITLFHHKLVQYLEHESIFSTILTLNVDGKKQQVLLKDIQRHPAKPFIQHIDFQRVSAREKIRTNIPIHLVGEEIAVGVKMGGSVFHHIADVEVSCLPKDLPEYLDVDISKLEIGGAIRLSEIVVPKGVELPILAQGEDFDSPVVTISAQLMQDETEAEEGEEGLAAPGEVGGEDED
ncbi:MAG: 50S ribosomal protein L25/general stress protein Ctc [Gammaproteobacteria bacterium]|nr:50S ribosomal protein L25/general stress protein Ctc [Gammaproteobacteria bacterium]